MAFRLLITRHGQTEWNLAGRYQGHADSPLTGVGLQQAERLYQGLRHRCLVALHDRAADEPCWAAPAPILQA